MNNNEAEEKLIQSDGKYHSLFQNSPLPIFVTDRNTSRILDVNKAAIRLYGYSIGELLTKDMTAIQVENNQVFVKGESRLQRVKYPETDIWYHKKKDGSIISVKIYSHDIIFDNIPASVIFAEDITERIKSTEYLTLFELKAINQQIEEQKEISRAIIEAQETERNRIGQELHDNINQLLASIKIYLMLVAKNSTEFRNAIKYPLQLLDKSIKEIRLLSSQHITPPGNINLKGLTQLLLRTTQVRKSTKIKFVYNLSGYEISNELKLVIYRVLQEQVNNIIKHSGATNISISIKPYNDGIQVIVSDNGKGFDTSKERKGIGITNMINRIKSFNGEIDIKSSPGNGTKTTIFIPPAGPDGDT